MARYLYSHPDGAGFGEAHARQADDALAERPIFPGQEATAGQNMATLDLPSGTVVDLDEDADTDQFIVTWADQFGTARRTAIDPKFFAAHFTEVDT
jgi:hypothetical protein